MGGFALQISAVYADTNRHCHGQVRIVNTAA